MKCPQTGDPVRFAPLHAVFGKFDPVIDRIPHQVRKRILDSFDNGLVEFGSLALHLEADFLVAAQRHIAHRAGKLFQMFPMGCMRVFITRSCTSVMIRFRRCETESTDVSSPELANCKSWLRASTSSPTRFIKRVQQIDSHTDRLDTCIAIPRLKNLLCCVNIIRAAETQRDQNFSEAPLVSALLLLKSNRQSLRPQWNRDLPATLQFFRRLEEIAVPGNSSDEVGSVAGNCASVVVLRGAGRWLRL